MDYEKLFFPHARAPRKAGKETEKRLTFTGLENHRGIGKAMNQIKSTMLIQHIE